MFFWDAWFLLWSCTNPRSSIPTRPSFRRCRAPQLIHMKPVNLYGMVEGVIKNWLVDLYYLGLTERLTMYYLKVIYPVEKLVVSLKNRSYSNYSCFFWLNRTDSNCNRSMIAQRFSPMFFFFSHCWWTWYDPPSLLMFPSQNCVESFLPVRFKQWGGYSLSDFIPVGKSLEHADETVLKRFVQGSSCHASRKDTTSINWRKQCSQWNK